jgi:hypothetical protein
VPIPFRLDYVIERTTGPVSRHRTDSAEADEVSDEERASDKGPAWPDQGAGEPARRSCSRSSSAQSSSCSTR